MNAHHAGCSNYLWGRMPPVVERDAKSRDGRQRDRGGCYTPSETPTAKKSEKRPIARRLGWFLDGMVIVRVEETRSDLVGLYTSRETAWFVCSATHIEFPK